MWRNASCLHDKSLCERLNYCFRMTIYGNSISVKLGFLTCFHRLYILMLAMIFMGNLSVVLASAAYVPTGYYQLNSALSDNMVVDIYDGIIKNETNIQLYTKNGGSNEVYYIEQVDSGWFTIAASTNHKMVMDVYAGSNSNR